MRKRIRVPRSISTTWRGKKIPTPRYLSVKNPDNKIEQARADLPVLQAALQARGAAIGALTAPEGGYRISVVVESYPFQSFLRVAVCGGLPLNGSRERKKADAALKEAFASVQTSVTFYP